MLIFDEVDFGHIVYSVRPLLPVQIMVFLCCIIYHVILFKKMYLPLTKMFYITN